MGSNNVPGETRNNGREMATHHQVMDQVGKQRESKKGLKGANFEKRKYLQQSFMGEGLMPLLGNQNNCVPL